MSVVQEAIRQQNTTIQHNSDSSNNYIVVIIIIVESMKTAVPNTSKFRHILKSLGKFNTILDTFRMAKNIQ